MKKRMIAGLFLSLILATTHAAPRNFLQQKYTLEEVKKEIVTDNSWVDFPAYRDREAWESFPDEIRRQYISNGEKYLNYTWPYIRATEYLAFTREGNRKKMEDPFNKRRAALQALTLAELIEGKGRFLDDIVNGVYTYCEMTYWGYSAHFYMYNKIPQGTTLDEHSTILPDLNNPIIDLGVGEVAADLSWIYYFFKEEFEKISPVINRRIVYELKRKVIDPYYERMDYWWITGWGKGNVNNWNPWCNTNVLNTIMLVEEDPDKRAEGVYKSMQSVDLFFNHYPDDGACDEGPSYWNAAGAKAFEYLSMLSKISRGKISIFEQPLIQRIGSYIWKVYIGGGKYYTNFADAPGVIRQSGSLIYRYGTQTGDTTMQAFGSYLLHLQHFEQEAPTGPLARTLDDLFTLKGWEEYPAREPLIGEYYFPDMQIAIGRNQAGSQQGFYFAAKGGHNAESHNHNDVGSCIVFYNGEPVFVDAGVGTYTAQTFSSGRYKIWTMQSDYHNLPRINGISQLPGRSYAARNPQFKATPSSISFQVDIAGAYPPEAKADSWVRGYKLLRDKELLITDRFSLQESNGETEVRFLTPLACEIISRSEIRLNASEFSLSMKFNPAHYTPELETRTIEDPKLKAVWGDSLTVVVLKTNDKKSGNYTITLRPNGK